MSPELGTIIVVEDDPHIADLVDLYLRRDGFRVLLATTGERGLELARTEGPRMVILDIGLPGQKDGLEVCKELRAESAVPVLFLTARDDEIDRVVGLELGADDYITKPFSPRELVARVRAVLRRSDDSMQRRPETLELGDLVLRLGAREVLAAGEIVELAAREFDLLAFLLSNKGLVLNRRQLLEGVWGPDWYGDERTVDVHVAQLRKKLGAHLPLTTVWGVGYRLG